MEFKFTKTPLMTMVGVGWIFVAIMNFALTCFLIQFSIFMAFLPLGTAILAGFLGFYYLNLFKRNYIAIDEDGIFVHKGMIYKQKRIIFNDIETIMEGDNKIRIQEKNGKETRIMLNMLELKGINEIRRVFEEKCKSKIIN